MRIAESLCEVFHGYQKSHIHEPVEAQPNRQKKTRESLKRYREKRDFTHTLEPSGDKTTTARKPAQKQLIFCVQKHLATALHYDFRLEWNGVLLSWAVPKGPSLRTADKRLAMRVEDHPFDYRSFEGVIPAGYGAGVVMLWDEGSWSPDPGFENVSDAIDRGELKFHLDGAKLKGGWVLVRTGTSTPTGERERWLLMKHRDEWAGDLDVAEKFPRSVRTDRSFRDIIKAAPDVWKSHKDGDPDLAKIVRKVLALEEREAPHKKAPAKKR